MGPYLVFTITLLVLFGMDLYAYQSFKKVFSNRWIRILYWAISISGYIYMIYTLTQFDRANQPRKVVNGFVTILMIWYVPKFIVLAFLIGEDIWRGIVALLRYKTAPERRALGEPILPGRRRFIHNIAIGLAAIPMVGVVHGIWKGKYNFRVIKKTIEFDDLPEAFDGFTITQVSDIHCGSFDNYEKIKYGVDLIKAQETDLFLFTGDMVNIESKEIHDWKDLFGSIKAPYGQYCVLGNHDYATYRTWSEDEDENERLAQADVEKLVRIQEDEMGYRNLRNEAVRLEKDGQHITLMGVENWGEGFHTEGKLEDAIKDVDEDDFKILMSHDPTHFDKKVKVHPKKVHLTLSGHTHGMQFGIEIPGVIKFSPIRLRYPKWAGLYQENDRFLYVNRGFGYLAFPGRVGIWPEITVFELRRKSNT
ncbi:MAG: metallophosphoesterase [Flavobacteriia bacterium]|nr:metallophosphoesterase [Flavobacteriia bacterium]